MTEKGLTTTTYVNDDMELDDKYLGEISGGVKEIKNGQFQFDRALRQLSRDKGHGLLLHLAGTDGSGKEAKWLLAKIRAEDFDAI